MDNREEYQVALRVRDVPYPAGELEAVSKEDETVSLRFREAAAPMGLPLPSSAPEPARPSFIPAFVPPAPSWLKSMAMSVEAMVPVLPKISARL